MSEAECIEATDSVIAEVEEIRKKRKYMVHNIAIGAFHDSRAMVDNIIKEVCAHKYKCSPRCAYHVITARGIV